MTTAKPLGHIEHVVVLMYENRSFDNLLGGLYPYGPNFEGVPPGWSNPLPSEKPGPLVSVPAFQAPAGYDARIMPFPDPNEEYAEMAEQIDGGSMKGFVKNYLKVVKKSSSPYANVAHIMQYYRAENLPITHTLAKFYAVSDGYFGSGPVQTWPNRLFAHCGTPGLDTKTMNAYLNNVDYPNYHDTDPFRGQLDYPTIFEQLDKAASSSRKAWKVYYDGVVPISAFLKYVHSHWNTFEGGNVYAYSSTLTDYADFAYDVDNNELPTYSFIEPRYQKYPFDTPPNSNHPGGSTVDEGLPPIDVAHGEQLLYDIYKKLSSNAELFKKTLLIITYDEHGGLFDHVTPPKAVSPFSDPSKVKNFAYTQYGPRVPAIFINPYVNTQVLRPPSGKYFDHTSIIATLRAQFAPGAAPLTARDRDAPTFAGLINSSREPIKAPELENPNAQPHPDYRKGVMPETYVPPKEPGSIADAIYRHYLANKDKTD